MSFFNGARTAQEFADIYFMDRPDGPWNQMSQDECEIARILLLLRGHTDLVPALFPNKDEAYAIQEALALIERQIEIEADESYAEDFYQRIRRC